jgi:hypothetical protein
VGFITPTIPRHVPEAICTSSNRLKKIHRLRCAQSSRCNVL